MKKNIIIVDNDEVVAYLTSYVVKELGNNALYCMNAFEVIEKVKIHPKFFNLIICNQSMNDFSDIQLAEEIYRINPDIALIVLAGEKKNSKNYDKYSNIKDIIIKPVSKKVLSKSLFNIFGKLITDIEDKLEV